MVMKRIVLFGLLCLSISACSLEWGLNHESDWEKFDYAITGTSHISCLDDLIKEKKIDGLTDELKEYIEFAAMKVDAINYDYPSIDPSGKKVTLSARLYVLDLQTKLIKKTPYVALANHASIVEARQCPTRNNKEEAIFAWLGCPVVMPDYYGFGASEDCPQAYLNSEVTARGNIDALKAALHILKDKKIKVGESFYNVGYSQGGFNAIANLKYVTDHPECGVKFQHTFAGAGSYDINGSMDEYLKDRYPAAAIFLPLTLVSVNECEKLGFDYSKMLTSPLCSHVKDWILAKKMSFGKIMDNIGSNKVADILTPGMISGESAEAKTFRKYFDEYSLINGWKNLGGTKVLLFHSKQDDVVPPFNSEELYDALKKAGANVKLVEGDYGAHTKAEYEFVRAIVDNI